MALWASIELSPRPKQIFQVVKKEVQVCLGLCVTLGISSAKHNQIPVQSLSGNSFSSLSYILLNLSINLMFLHG